MSSSVVACTRSRSMRPLVGASGADRFVVGISFSPVGAPRRDDASATVAPSIDDDEHRFVDGTDRNHAPFAVLHAPVLPLYEISVENPTCKLEIDAALLEVPSAFVLVVIVLHQSDRLGISCTSSSRSRCTCRSPPGGSATASRTSGTGGSGGQGRRRRFCAPARPPAPAPAPGSAES